jgi:nucleoside-diphosphate-sugar epimerase
MTGAGGFLGGRIRQCLSENGSMVIAISDRGNGLDLSPRISCSMLDQLGPLYRDVLVLCGAMYYKGDDSQKLSEMHAYNCIYTQRVVDAFIRAGGTRVCFFSSYMQLYSESSQPYAGAYIETKRRMLDYINCQHRVEVLNLVIYDNWCSGDSRPKFVPLLLNALENEREFLIPAPDTLMDIADSDALAIEVAHQIQSFEPKSISMATGEPVTLGDLARSIEYSFGATGSIKYGDEPPVNRSLPYVDLPERQLACAVGIL